MKRLLLPILIGLLLISVSACSNTANETQPNTVTPETEVKPVTEPVSEPTPEPVETIEFTTEGLYKLFGVMNEGMLVESSELQMESEIVLDEGGTGSVSFEGESVDITKWELNEDVASITLADGGQANAKTHDGILELDLYGDSSMVLYYAQDNADISGYEFLTLEQVKEKINGN